jgi:ribosomal protein L7Ae-like RNA K-turn-binding protein
VRGGFARALRRAVKVDIQLLTSQAGQQIDRRIQGLVGAAVRRRQVALGTDAVISALAACTPPLLLVAKDAAGRREDVVALAAQRRVPVLEVFDKDTLGSLTGKAALSFIAVLDDQFAREIVESARWLAGLSEDG